MEEPISKRTANPPGNPPPRDESFGLDPEIRFYAIEDSDITEEGESKILVFTTKASRQLQKEK